MAYFLYKIIIGDLLKISIERDGKMYGKYQ